MNRVHFLQMHVTLLVQIAKTRAHLLFKQKDDIMMKNFT